MLHPTTLHWCFICVAIQTCISNQFMQNLDKLVEQQFGKKPLLTKQEPVCLSGDVVSLFVPKNVPGWKVSTDRTTKVRSCVHILWHEQVYAWCTVHCCSLQIWWITILNSDIICIYADFQKWIGFAYTWTRIRTVFWVPPNNPSDYITWATFCTWSNCAHGNWLQTQGFRTERRGRILPATTKGVCKANWIDEPHRPSCK